VSTKTFPEWKTNDKNPSNLYTRITNACGIICTSDASITGNTIEDCSIAGLVVDLRGTWNPATQSNRDQKTVVATVVSNTTRNCKFGIGYNDADVRGFAEIAENSILGALEASITKVEVGDLPTLPAGNKFGPYKRISGAPDIGNGTTAIANRYSFSRNKVVPATV
jgi:hypothetical protein